MENILATVELGFSDAETSRSLFGQHDQNLRQLERSLALRVSARGDKVQIEGDSLAVEVAHQVLQQLYGVVKRGFPVYPVDIGHAVTILSKDSNAKLKDIFLDTVFISATKKVIVPKTQHQKAYIDAIRGNDIVFGIGPAGTGKTYLAMAMALSALTKHQVKRIILVRPAVEAGERLGFLPGDLAEKVNPYLRPLHDALFDMMDFDRARTLIDQGVIEVAPLAFMRGRTLNSSFVILDEAQNTTREQMKMFLTRLGFDSKAVVTGDLTQTDLPDSSRSGLNHTKTILEGIEGIEMVEFTDIDVVRHPLVQKIILAYDRAEARLKADAGTDGK
ncbi:MAG: phosphate starvation-inducible protein PhoH [Deltaproteobacteria bacterium CG2_30_63_29]|nr:MAG: phosphate starvation-inducible protein PhoH [Deltaproteobacteria bacterium CG2_30_63_29]PIW00959.1 MAG: phosphate starvation-inducible protein PhoH [Deltaproteobacteria bacterium CG17_big_fil_post_rev_8_21_14_2_50_63_7]PJB40539.1 MAG: phosphate starvation-inducible protein PhoH [Deltaproteobacteria bacterium CG_4_9_14_3_um_filter_63_12]